MDNLHFFRCCIYLILFSTQLFAQNGSWVYKKLPAPLGNNWSRSVGGNCCIFVHKDSNYVVAYDNVSAQWHETKIDIDLPWENTLAGDSVALVWNNNNLVGFSALNHNFVRHTYGGTPIGGLTGYKASNTLACFITTDSCYIFDAEDSRWHVYGYNPPAYGDSMHVTIYAEKDYILVSLTNRYGWIENTLIAYSSFQKKFWELNGDYIVFQLLIDGFAFYRDYGEEADCYLGAWSAVTSQDAIVDHQKPGFLHVNEQNQGTAFIFQTVDDSNYPEIVYYYYGYDTRHGTFKVISVSNDYGGNEKTALNWELFRNGALTSYRYIESGQTEYYIYSGDTHSFSYVGPIDLGYDPAIHPNYGHALGNNVMMASGCSSIIGYDIQSGGNALAALPTPTSGYQNPVSYWSMKNSAHAHCKRALTYKFHIYTYHNLHANTITELVENVPDQLGNGYTARFAQENVFGFLLEDSTHSDILLLYSPTDDQWTRRILSEEPAAFGSHRDFIFWADSDGNITIFNGKTNSEYQIAFRDMLYWQYENYILHRDNYFIAYTSTDQFVSYSAYTNTGVSFSSELFSLKGGRGKVVLYESGDSKQYLGYSSIFNTFSRLELAEEDGISLSPLGGDNTALVMTSEGSLYAFNPYAEASDIQDDKSEMKLLSRFRLSQNYPNPFNPVTMINYQLPVTSSVDLSIYNLLGQKVLTLVSEKQRAGYHQVEWDASGFASGVYYYRIQAGEFQDVKKMVLIR